MAGFDTTITQPTDAATIGDWILTQTGNVLNNAVNGPMEKLWDALSPVIIVGLTIQFLAYAYMLTSGNGTMSVTDFFKKAIMVVIIGAFFGSAGAFQTNIANTMLSLPDDVATLTSGTKDIGKEVDKLQTEASKAANAMTNAGDSGWFQFLPSGQEVLVSIIAVALKVDIAIVGGIMVVLMMVCQVGMALVVAAAPIFIAFLLFEPTKQMFNSWVSAAFNFVFLAMLLGLVLGFLLQMNLGLMRLVATDVNAGAVDVFTMLAASTLMGLASIVIMIMLPSLASSLSGGFGAHFGVGSAASGAMSGLRIKSMMRMIPGAGSARGAARAAASSAKK